MKVTTSGLMGRLKTTKCLANYFKNNSDSMLGDTVGSYLSRIMAEKLLHLQNADPERVMELEKVSDSRGRHPLVQIPEKED